MGRKKLFNHFFAICFTLVPLVAAGKELIEINRVVARVNDRIITLGEIDRAMDRMNFTDSEKQKDFQTLWTEKLTDFYPSVLLKNKVWRCQNLILNKNIIRN